MYMLLPDGIKSELEKIFPELASVMRYISSRAGTIIEKLKDVDYALWADVSGYLIDVLRYLVSDFLV